MGVYLPYLAVIMSTMKGMLAVLAINAVTLDSHSVSQVTKSRKNSAAAC